MFGRSLSIALTFFVLPAAAVATIGCGPRNQYFEPPPPEVTVAAPLQQDVTRFLELTGTTQPIVTVDIRARVRGFLKERQFQEGRWSSRGSCCS